MTNFKTPKIHSEKHRRFIASQPCIVTGSMEGVQCHHLLRVESIKGMGIKTSDVWCVPLHFRLHDALHKNGNEIAFFASHGLSYESVKAFAMQFASLSPDKRIRDTVQNYETII